MTQQTSGTKYVFASTNQHEMDVGTKVCPRCGQVLFEDMDTCFDCLYSFVKDTRHAPSLPEPLPPRIPEAPAVPSLGFRVQTPGKIDDLLSAIELDEIDEVEDDEPEEPISEPMANARHRRREPSSQEDTLDLATMDMTKVVVPKTVPLRAVIRSKSMQVRIPLSASGLTVGRGEENDIVLRSRLVSRQHLSLMPQGTGVEVRDRGATNPALIHGEPLEGSAHLTVGDLIDICGITIELEEVSQATSRLGRGESERDREE